MAEKGGYQRPKDRTPKAPGVGKGSKRTDRQLIATPSVQESTDLQVGDQKRIRALQGEGLPATSTPRVSAPPRGGSPAAGAGAELPPHLMTKPTTRPMEDEMTPASPAPIEPMDDKEVVLQFLIDTFGDENASQMLNDIRASRQAPEPQTAPPMQTAPAPEMVEEPGEPEAMDLGEQPLDEEVVDQEAPLA